MTWLPRPSRLRALATAALLAAVGSATLAHEHAAHVHGQLQLGVAVDANTLTLTLDSPLDSLVGFERAPRTGAERKTVQAAVAKLRAADTLFLIDPAAGCKLKQVDLEAPVLGLGSPGPAESGGHADLDGRFTFECTAAAQARFIDVGLFTAFRHARQVDAQIAAPQGQFQRTLKRPSRRLAWGK